MKIIYSKWIYRNTYILEISIYLFGTLNMIYAFYLFVHLYILKSVGVIVLSILFTTAVKYSLVNVFTIKYIESSH